MEQQPYQGFSPEMYGAAPAYAPPPPPPPMLRPLSTGEILDRTMALYRQNFWLFAGIGAAVAVVSTLSSVVRLIFMGTVQIPWSGLGAARDPAATQESMRLLMRTELYALPMLLLFVVAYGISKAAAVEAVVALSEGRTISAVEAYRAVGSRWLRWVGIVLRQYWAMLWPIALGGAAWAVAVLGAASAFKGSPAAIGLIALFGVLFFLAGMVLGVLNYLRVALAEVAGVVEDMGVGAAMKRSRVLVAGRKGRIFLTVLLVYVLWMVAGVLQVPFAFAAGFARGAAHVLLLVGSLVIGFVATSLVLPIASIAFTLLYQDERVRREGYDIELLLQRSVVANDRATSAPMAEF